MASSARTLVQQQQRRIEGQRAGDAERWRWPPES